MADDSLQSSNGSAVTEEVPAVPDYLATPNAVFTDEGVQWRYGKPPDYSKTRKVWEEGKKSNHSAGSLPQLIENLVKNWEVEASFKPRLQDWRTIDKQNYTFTMNGGCPQSAEHMLKVGTYNAIIEPNEYYSPEHSDFASSHKIFKRMMPTFAWEVVEVYSGPPTVTFKWRHWGVMKNDYVGFNNKGEKVTAKAHGGPIEIFGITVAQVDDKVRLQAVDTWMDPLAMFRQIAPYGVVNKEPMDHKVNKVDALDAGFDRRFEHELDKPNGEHFDNLAPQEGAANGVSESTKQPADAVWDQVEACPFVPHQRENIENTAELPQPQQADIMNVDGSAAESQTSNRALLDTEDLVPEILPPTTTTGTGQGDIDVPKFEAQAPADHNIEMDIEKPVSNRGDVTAVAGAEDTLAMSTDIGNGSEQTAGGIVDQPSTATTVEETIPRSIYSSAITGDVEDVIKIARSEDFVDESIATGTYDAIDEHLESPAQEVHPHPKDVEEAVKPNAGEAVTASAESEETRKTYEEMSNVSSDEFIMNRE